MNQRRLINKGMMMDKIEAEFDSLLRIIVRQDETNYELERKLKISEKNRKDLAVAYAKKLGVIMTKKQFERKFMNLQNRITLSDKNIIYLNNWADSDESEVKDFRRGYHKAVSDISKELGITKVIDDVYKRKAKIDVVLGADEK